MDSFSHVETSAFGCVSYVDGGWTAVYFKSADGFTATVSPEEGKEDAQTPRAKRQDQAAVALRSI